METRKNKPIKRKFSEEPFVIAVVTFFLTAMLVVAVQFIGLTIPARIVLSVGIVIIVFYTAIAAEGQKKKYLAYRRKQLFLKRKEEEEKQLAELDDVVKDSEELLNALDALKLTLQSDL